MAVADRTGELFDTPTGLLVVVVVAHPHEHLGSRIVGGGIHIVLGGVHDRIGLRAVRRIGEGAAPHHQEAQQREKGTGNGRAIGSKGHKGNSFSNK